jgi:hypothetical protein
MAMELIRSDTSVLKRNRRDRFAINCGEILHGRSIDEIHTVAR